jgi:polyhydroxyalkanoate synthesis regulator phasin
MPRRLLGLPLAGLLLIGGATAVLAQSGVGSTVAEAATGATTVLGQVLDELVGDGTITQDQADAIGDAVEERRTELREQAEALREQMRQFLEDGVLSAEELAQLPEDHPLRNLDQFLDDGQLTTEELRQLRGFGFGPGHHFRGPFHGGPGMELPVDPDTDSDSDPDAEGSSTSTL